MMTLSSFFRRAAISWVLSLALLVVAIPGSRSFAQAVNSQQISGTVSDPSGAVVANVDVTVTNTATGISRAARTNSDGNYTVLDLPIGTYTVSTSAPGFKKVSIENIEVEVGGKPSVPVTLAIGSQSESVTVQSDTAQIQTTSAEIGGVVTSTEATQIQLNGRNYIQLLTLQPGVSQTIASGFALFGTYGVSGSSQSVNGVRTDSANYFIDGVDNKDNGGGGNNFVNISPDSLQEFRNAASSYDASYGGTSGATISVAIKSGGRNFHGNAYEYLRNDAVQAYPFRAISTYQSTQPFLKPPLRYNDFGYTIGGPIWVPNHFNQNREKLFFFAAQEYKRLRTSTVTNVSVPTTYAIANAIATGPSTATGRALAASILTVAPPAGNPTALTGNFGYLSLGNNNQAEYLFKIDYNINEKNQISGHFVHDRTFNVGGPTNYLIYDRTIPGLTSSVQWTHTFNAKSVNIVTGSWSGNVINEGGNIRPNPQFGNIKVLRSDFGLTYSTLYNASPYIPQITISGLGNPGFTPRAFDNSQRIYAIKDDFSRVLGNHSVKAGAYFWRARKNQTAPPQLNGAFTFGSVASLVAGNFSTYTEGSAIPQIQARFPQFETYLQDDWTVSRRLTANIGLRWQYMPPIASWPNNTSFFDPNFYDPTKAATISPTTGFITSAPAPYNGLILPGTGFSDKAKQVVAPSVYNNPAVQSLFHGLPGGIINTALNTFAPRVGFAYDLTGRQTTILHAGYGMSYERVEGNYIYGASSQVPFIANASLANSNADTLGGTGTTSAPQNISNSADRGLVPPRIHNYSLGVQHKLFTTTSTELNYVGSRSANLTWVRDINQGAPGTQQANPGVQLNSLRPYKGYGEILEYTNGAHENYNSLQARMQTRFSRGGLVTLAYTWSQNLTNGSAYNYQPQDSTNLYADYGEASYNQRKIFVASYVYPLPFWLHDRTWYKKILGGWQFSGITRIASGLPINIIQPSGQSVAGNLVTTSNVAQRPNLIGNPYLPGSGKQYLNPAAFAVPAPGTYGNLGYDAIKGPLFDNWDSALQKNIELHEAIGLEFRAEMFNVPNHLSPFGIGGTLGSAQANGTYQPNFSSTGAFQNSFGQVTSATDPRTMEFVLRLHF